MFLSSRAFVPRASQPSHALFDGTLSSLCHLIPSSVHCWKAWDKRPLDLSLPPWWELLLTPQISAPTANYWHPISQHFTGPSQPVPGIQEMERDAIPLPYALAVNALLPKLPLVFLTILFTCHVFCSLCPSADICFFFPLSCPASGWPGMSRRLAWDELQMHRMFPV